MRIPPRVLAKIGAVPVLIAVFTVLGAMFTNFATDADPQFNLVYLPHAVVCALLVVGLQQFTAARLPAPKPSPADPSAARDRQGYLRLLKQVREQARLPRFDELRRRAAERGLDYRRADFDEIAKGRLGWLAEPERAEPIIRAFLVAHEADDSTVEKWIDAYHSLGGRERPPPRRSRIVAGAVISFAAVVVIFLGYLVYLDRYIPEHLRRSGVTLLSVYAHRLPLVVGAGGLPRARLGGSFAHVEPGPERLWDLAPVKRDGAFHHLIRSRRSGLCLTPEAKRIAQGVNLTEAPCDESADQLWRLSAKDGTIAVTAPDGDYCVEPNRGSTDAGAPLTLLPCDPSRRNQRWLVSDRLPGDLGGTIASAENGHCLDVWGATGRLITWDCHGRDNQVFTYQRVTGGNRIRNGAGCLTVDAGLTLIRRPACTGAADEVWAFDPRDAHDRWQYWEIKHVASGRCLELGAPLKPCTRSNLQQWRTPDWLAHPSAPDPAR
ncbi:ricin-type beta-trefoil lectin domain protein [Nonomuraea sp. NN258]|uniref:RICIN domain-containing protein n=1 Tax=Nonomuraea antri TaxID=2730852 RepID=UPI0015680843|nr:RICIN domain-containing protein [Nonomuraea antri]NRQ36135.1 ricin-type beta-trefoil lectin domain protein [Nonomuraea antri]